MRKVADAGGPEGALKESLRGAATLTLVHAALAELIPPPAEGEARWIGGQADPVAQGREVHVGRAFAGMLVQYLHARLSPHLKSGELKGVVGVA